VSKNSPDGNRKRSAAYREKLKAQGLAPILLHVPDEARPALHRAAALIREGMDPSEALRTAAGSEGPPDSEVIDQLRQEVSHLRQQLSQRQAVGKPSGWGRVRRWLGL
jgi:hypothetical protein